jgi:toxin ParE1/3/4
MANYFLSNKAVEDLSIIWDYTYDLWSESQADKYYKELIDTCKSLSEHPNIGKVYDKINLQMLGFPINKHIIFYRIIKPDTIEIVRILGGNMDIKNRFSE